MTSWERGRSPAACPAPHHAAEAERRREISNVGNDVALIDQRMRSIDRMRHNLVRAIAFLDDDGDAAALMTKELTALSGQRRQLDAERDLTAAQVTDEAAETQKLNDLAIGMRRRAGASAAGGGRR